MSDATLEELAGVLAAGGFTVEFQSLGGIGTCLVAETHEALVLCASADWETVGDVVERAQATLTNLAALHPSPRSWDLYVVAAIESVADDAQELLRERLEHDTRYARKFVLAGNLRDAGAVTRGLLPLLPLRPATTVELADPVDTLREELLEAGADRDAVELATSSFRATGEVEVR